MSDDRGAALQRLCQEYQQDPASASCCATDDTVALAWCQATASRADPAYDSLCRPWSAAFAAGGASVVGGAARTADPSDWRTLPSNGGGAFCDVLGERQRAWLARSLAQSTARLNIVVAPGGLLGNPAAAGSGGCTGTEWDCYRPAQVNLLHTLANTTACTIILSGADHPRTAWSCSDATNLPAKMVCLIVLNRSVCGRTVAEAAP